MIRTITLALTAIIIMSSCANKFSLVKRKYTKGYYVSGTKARHTTPKNTVIAKHSVKHETATPASETKAPVETVNTRVENVPVLVNQPANNESIALKEQKQPEKTVTALASTRSANNFSKSSILALKPLVLSKAMKTDASKGDKDALFIVLVILCFFWWLNLISVYIHDGKKITTNFWVTLLLNFTFIGGIIFALLVVLDVVDLK
ncbi:MAG: hypothetical protein V4635_10200 [Bacteroidota bacterium]